MATMNRIGTLDNPASSTAAATKRKRRRPLPPLMVDARRAAFLFSLGLRTWRALDAAGKVPKPTKLSARVLWYLPELRRWARAGCPDRLAWERIKEQGSEQKARR